MSKSNFFVGEAYLNILETSMQIIFPLWNPESLDPSSPKEVVTAEPGKYRLCWCTEGQACVVPQHYLSLLAISLTFSHLDHGNYGKRIWTRPKMNSLIVGGFL